MRHMTIEHPVRLALGGVWTAVLFIVVVFQPAQAQYVLQSSVFSNGLASMTNAQYRFTVTAGQPVIGEMMGSGTPSYGHRVGFWFAQHSVLTGINPTAGVPTEFRLEQNYPNPFNPTTVIRAQWPVAGNVELVVYDLLGRVVATLARGYYPPSRQSFTFDAAGLASGIYFYRLQVGSYVQTRRFVVLR
ncbi:MAG: T9SS type A sorting domain-containing protein [Bacteroidota bacterium]